MKRLGLAAAGAFAKGLDKKTDAKYGAAQKLWRMVKPPAPTRVADGFMPYKPTWAAFTGSMDAYGPTDFQATGSSFLIENERAFLCDDMGLGKLLANSEPVLTSTGWKAMGALVVGDRVIGNDGKPTAITHVFPQGPQQIVKVTFSDGSWVRASWDHLWNVQHARNNSRRNSEVWRTMTTREIVDAKLTDGAGNRTWKIPMTKPVQYDSVELPMEPYLLGVLLGNGSLGRQISITGDRDISELLQLEGYHRSHHSAGITQFYVQNKTVYTTLQELGLTGHRSWEKFVPEEFLRGTPFERLALLQGLMDTDGYAMPEGGAEFSSTSSNLIDAVMELTQSLGGVARGRRVCASTYTYKGEKKQGRRAERVNIKLPPSMNPFRGRKALLYKTPTKYPPTRLIVSVEEDGVEEATCIRVAASNGLFLTRSFVVTHNSKQFIDAMQYLSENGADAFSDEYVQRILIICEASNVDTWMHELQENAPNAARYAYRGKKHDRGRNLFQFLNVTPVVKYPMYVVVSYALFRDDIEEFEMLKFDSCALDEGQYVKGFPLNGSQSQISKMIHRVVARRRYIISGTPIINTLADLWNQLKWLGLMEMTWEEFESHCILTRTKVNKYVERKSIRSYTLEMQTHIRKLMMRFSIRRLKNEVTDIPQSITTRVNVLQTLAQEKEYREKLAIHLRAVNDLAIGEDAAINPLVSQMRLRQLTSKYNAESDELLDRVNSAVASGQKVIIYTAHLETLRVLYTRLKSLGVVYIHGEVSTNATQGEISDRQKVVDRFQTDDTVRILMATSQSCRVGLTLTAATVIMFCDLPWSPKNMQQNIDRAVRIGQRFVVNVYQFFSVIRSKKRVGRRVQTIDGTVFHTVMKKGREADAIMDGRAKPQYIAKLLEDEVDADEPTDEESTTVYDAATSSPL